MGFFVILLTIMKENFIFDVGREPEFTIGIYAPLWSFSLAYSPENLQEILKNLNKAPEKYLERDSLLEKIKAFNQDLSICRNNGTVLVLKLDIDFITLWDDPM